mgnify:CR=1 FL=1|jgi:hypothetical protein
MATIQRIPVSGDGTVAVPSEWFIARITSVAASQSGSASCLGYAHGWIEQSICANGFSYEDDPEGQSGTTTVDPAFALDGTQASVDDIVLMRPRSIGANDLTIFEFFKGGGTPNNLDCPHVTSVQCTGGMLVVTYDTTCVGV